MINKELSCLVITKVVYLDNYQLNNGVIPYSGKYKTFDCILDNCLNSELENIFISGNKLKYLKFHNLNKKFNFNYFECEEESGKIENYIDFLDRCKEKYIVISLEPYISKINYKEMLEFHKKNNLKITKCFFKNITDRVGVFLLEKEYLKEILMEYKDKYVMKFDFYSVINNKFVELKETSLYKTNSECFKIFDLKSFWNLNMRLLNPKEKLLLPLEETMHSVKKYAQISRCILGENCEIHGKIDHSIIFSDVVVPEKANIKNCIVLEKANIKKDISYSNCVIGRDFCIDIRSKYTLVNNRKKA